MPRIQFVGNEFGPAAAVEAPDGGALVDICDDAHAPVPFSCRSASCGTCRVEVLAGAALFTPAAQDELAVLDVFGTTRTHRLACQAVVLPGPGLVVLRSASDD